MFKLAGFVGALVGFVLGFIAMQLLLSGVFTAEWVSMGVIMGCGVGVALSETVDKHRCSSLGIVGRGSFCASACFVVVVVFCWAMGQAPLPEATMFLCCIAIMAIVGAVSGVGFLAARWIASQWRRLALR